MPIAKILLFFFTIGFKFATANDTLYRQREDGVDPD